MAFPPIKGVSLHGKKTTWRSKLKDSDVGEEDWNLWVVVLPLSEEMVKIGPIGKVAPERWTWDGPSGTWELTTQDAASWNGDGPQHLELWPPGLNPGSVSLAVWSYCWMR